MNYEAKIVVTFKLEEFIELWNSIYSKIISYLNCYKNDIFFLQNFVWGIIFAYNNKVKSWKEKWEEKKKPFPCTKISVKIFYFVS